MNKEKLLPVKYIKTLGDLAYVVQCNDANNYVLKSVSKKKRSKELVNEFIVGKLAEKLELPIIPIQLIDVSETWKKEHLGNISYQNGPLIAFRYMENCSGYMETVPPKKAGLVNTLDELAGMVVFDQWVNNTDRSRTNILFKNLNEGYLFYMIDHGRCFPGGYLWSKKTLRKGPTYRINMPVYKWAFSLLDKEERLSEFAEKIAAVDECDIYDIIQAVPREWNISSGERDAMCHYLVREQKNIWKVTQEIIDKYGALIKQ